MKEAINELIKCLSEIYFIIGVVSLFVLYQLKRREFFFLLLCILVLLMERSFFSVLSSRYFEICIVIFLFIFILLLNKSTIGTRLIRYTLLLSLLVAVFYNLIKCFHSSRNNYVFDMRESVERINLRENHKTIFIDKKEFKRLFDATHNELNQKEIVDFPLTTGELEEVFSQYSFWEDEAFFYSSNKALQKKTIQLDINGYSYILKKIENYNKYNNKGISVYWLDKYHTPLFFCPELRNNAFTNNVLENGILKTCKPQYDTYVFQLGGQLIWFIGRSIKETWVIFHLRTDRPDLLPPKRIQYKFDGRSFPIEDSPEIGLFEHYRVMVKDIPTEYPITKINIGLSQYFEGSEVWFNSFQISDF